MESLTTWGPDQDLLVAPGTMSFKADDEDDDDHPTQKCLRRVKLGLVEVEVSTAITIKLYVLT